MWLYILSFIVAPLGYISKILISSEVSVSELGILYGIISLITLLSAVSDIGISESLKYHLPILIKEKKYSEIKGLLVSSSLVYITVGVLLGIVCFLGSNLLGIILFESTIASEILKVFALFFLGLNLFHGISHFFLAVQNTILYKISEFLRHSLILGSIIFIILFDITSLIALSYAWIIGVYGGLFFAICFFATYYYKEYFSGVRVQFNIGLLKKYFSYGLIAFLSSQVAIILSQIDMQMLLLLMDTQAAGYYSVYLSLIMIPFLIISPIFLLLFPIFSHLSAQNKTREIIQMKQTLTHTFFTIGIYFSAFLFIFSHEISHVFFGERFLFSGEILRYSIPFLICNLFFQINYCLLGGLGKVKYKLYISLIVLCINGLLNIILIQSIGVPGAALATALGWVAVWGMSEYVLEKQYRFHFKELFHMGSIGVCIFLSGGSLYFQSLFLQDTGRIETCMILLLCSVVWLMIFAIYHKKKIGIITKIFLKKSV